MIVHVVLFSPKPDLSEADRRKVLDALAAAAKGIPSIRQLRVAKRVKHGLPGYEQLMPQDFEFALIVEVDDIDRLKRYLQAPAHAALGHLFYTATTAALAYDYQFEDPDLSTER